MAGRKWLVAAAAALVAALPLADGVLMAGFRGVGYTVCHQIPDHSIFVAGQQLPLCARCTGIYLGFLVGLLGLALVGKTTASRLPPRQVTAILLLSLLAMAADGLNSLLSAFPAGPHAYEPSNLLRLATGTSAGASIALLLVPQLNDALWARPDPSESVSNLGELGGYAVLVALAVVVVHSAHPALLYPTAVASTVGVFATLSAAGAVLAATLAGKGRRAASLRDATRPLLSGFALAAVSMATLGIARAHFAPWLGG